MLKAIEWEFGCWSSKRLPEEYPFAGQEGAPKCQLGTSTAGWKTAGHCKKVKQWKTEVEASCDKPERCGIPGIPCWLARGATHDYGGLRWGCGRPATRSVSLGSNAGALDTPYSNTNTTIPTKGQAIPRQLSDETVDYLVLIQLLSTWCFFIYDYPNGMCCSYHSSSRGLSFARGGYYCPQKRTGDQEQLTVSPKVTRRNND
jgi:hypothetical protein